jgi:hypothetical protein
MRRTMIALGAALVALVAVVGPVSADSARSGSGSSGGHLPVRVPDAGLTEAWWQTYAGLADDKAFDRCDLGSGRVLFLAGTGGGAATRSCPVPKGRSLLVPLINVECSTVEGNGSTYRELRRCVEDIADDFTAVNLTIDGVAVRHLERFRVQSGLFYFTSVEGNFLGIPASGGPTKSVSDGYWAQVGPLRPGRHTVSFGGEWPPGQFKTTSVYHLTVS